MAEARVEEDHLEWDGEVHGTMLRVPPGQLREKEKVAQPSSCAPIQDVQPIAGTISEPMAGLTHSDSGTQSVLLLISETEKKWGNTPLPERLQVNLNWWKKVKAPQPVLDLIQFGVNSDFPLPEKMSTKMTHKSRQDICLAEKFLEDYQLSGAVQKLDHTPSHLPHLVPWFSISKKRGRYRKTQNDIGLPRIKSIFCSKEFSAGSPLPRGDPSWHPPTLPYSQP